MLGLLTVVGPERSDMTIKSELWSTVIQVTTNAT